MTYDLGKPEEAPEHLVRAFARTMPLESFRAPHRGTLQIFEARLAQARLTVNAIWREAHFAGQAWNEANRPTGKFPIEITFCMDCPHREAGLAGMPVPVWPLASMGRGYGKIYPQQEDAVTAKNSKQDDEADRRQRAAQAREQAAHMREQGNHERAQQLEQEAVDIEQGTAS